VSRSAAVEDASGVGALTALAFVLIIGDAKRFQCGKQVASYLGLVPLEDCSGNRRRLGHITKQGSSMLRFLLVEAAQVTVRSLPNFHVDTALAAAASKSGLKRFTNLISSTLPSGMTMNESTTFFCLSVFAGGVGSGVESARGSVILPPAR
jgi:transposase